ncbi:hypothetical protein CTAYLR_008248 [Chrysophaeum taylorii]|uniref:PX domain-containing protein n=1 Tax=Chrysophaeum taylorii TaxID=2483200 RepID=A0AAD7XPA3_9STRA|nr:hypothetical protein CTAYLR_008248 [Chrysophaeum taylorii]
MESLVARIVPRASGSVVWYEVTTTLGSNGTQVAQTRRRYSEFRELRRSLPTVRAKFPSRMPTVSSALGLDESRATALETWLGEVLASLASREVDDEGAVVLRKFLGLVEDDGETTTAAFEDDSIEVRAVEAEQRVAILEREKADLETRGHEMERARLAVSRDRDSLLARCAALEAERDALRRMAETLGRRHADLLLQVGGEQLASSIRSSSLARDDADADYDHPDPPKAVATGDHHGQRRTSSCSLLFGACQASSS